MIAHHRRCRGLPLEESAACMDAWYGRSSRASLPSEGWTAMYDALDVTHASDGLLIRIPEESGNDQSSQDWVDSILEHYSTTTRVITVDLSRCKAVASSFLAQLLLLRREVSARGGV